MLLPVPPVYSKLLHINGEGIRGVPVSSISPSLLPEFLELPNIPWGESEIFIYFFFCLFLGLGPYLAQVLRAYS